ncbi:MAG: tetratricopeptide repeat protein [Balneolaceae bacterium]|nr:tetratricopeptide repeat protein [Balneolaceae bacterium]
MAEHSVKLQEWSQAEDFLTSGLGKLEKGILKARAYFLYGQVLEIQDRFQEASFAYGRAKQNQPDFELLYWSNFKQAEVLRKMGNLDRALAIYEQMRKDDKNVERLPEIYYEIARTHEAKGDIELAQQIYKNILRSQTYTTPKKHVLISATGLDK